MTRAASESPDDVLVVAAILGDLAAFDQLVLRYRAAVVRVAQGVVGREHAEDVAMRSLLAEYGAAGLKGLHIILNLSKSPCSSTFGTTDKKPGCAENLVKFAKTYKVRITLICRGLYKGLEGSWNAVLALRAEGITVSIDERLGAQKRFGEHKDDEMSDED